MNHSVAVNDTREYVWDLSNSPFISRVTIKVCYVSYEPNKNGSVITKAMATQMAKTLRGCPIVGYYDNNKEDFKGHEVNIVNENETYKIVDATRPYGFIDLNSEIWFEKYLDDNVEHEYLCVNGFVWDGIYSEAKHIIEKGNNQSMELDSDSLKGLWAKNAESNEDIFIITDGQIKKLCILGEDVEPCFEGSSITAAFDKMQYELNNTLKGGQGTNMDPMTIPEYAALKADYDKLQTELTEQKDKYEAQLTEEKNKYSALETELNEQKEKYSALETEFNEQKTKYEQEKAAETEKYAVAESELTELREFQTKVQKKEKQDMIASFYFLNDEDKKDVTENIDKYSLADIESKLSIMAVRKRVKFNDDGDVKHAVYNLNGEGKNDEAPAWIQAVLANSND